MHSRRPSRYQIEKIPRVEPTNFDLLNGPNREFDRHKKEPLLLLLLLHHLAKLLLQLALPSSCCSGSAQGTLLPVEDFKNKVRVKPTSHIVDRHGAQVDQIVLYMFRCPC